MDEHENADDPFLERRLGTLALLPVADRPPIDDLAGVPIDDVAPDHRRSHRLWLLTGAAAAVLLVVLVAAGLERTREAGPVSGVGGDVDVVEVDPPVAVDGTFPSPSPLPEVTTDVTTDPPSTLDRLASIDALVGPRWELEAVVVDGVRTSAGPTSGAGPAWLRFTSDMDRFTGIFGGSDGCNDIGGDVVPLSSTLTFQAMSSSLAACPDGTQEVVSAAMAAVLEGEATYATDGETLTITKGSRTLELRSAGDPEDATDTALPGWWTGYETSGDDRTVTFTLGCTYSSAERFVRAEVEIGSFGDISVRAIVVVPSDRTSLPACTAGDRTTFTVTLDEPVAGRLITQPSNPAPTPPDQ